MVLHGSDHNVQVEKYQGLFLYPLHNSKSEFWACPCLLPVNPIWSSLSGHNPSLDLPKLISSQDLVGGLNLLE